MQDNALIASLRAQSGTEGRDGESARQYLLLYERARAEAPSVILELGTQRGLSTRLLLSACKEEGRVCSVDIEDCSEVSDDPRWQFVLSDSADGDTILAAAPYLRDGIDVLLVDSLHTRDHVARELTAWFPWVRQDGLIIFDDVDPFIYRKGERKDNVGTEFANHDIQGLLIETFRSNPGSMTLELHFGSSGLAIARKRSALGEGVSIPGRRSYRTEHPYWRARFALARIMSRLR